MNSLHAPLFRRLPVVCSLLLLVQQPHDLPAEPAPAALAAFRAYAAAVESRLVAQHRSHDAFLAWPQGDLSERQARLRHGEPLIERIREPTAGAAPEALSGALLHHWRGTAFAAGASAGDFERLMRDFKSYPQKFAPQVLRASAIAEEGDRVQASMRVRQHHVLTVVMDTTYDVTFRRLDVAHGYSLSRSTRIGEIDAPGTSAERVLPSGEEHGFLWRLNTYWSYEERDGGLYLQVETISLTRSIPRGLGWAVQPYVESIPRESLDFTLWSACRAMRNNN